MKMIQLNQCLHVHGGSYVSSLLSAVTDGLDDGEKAIGVTGLAGGFVVGSLLGFRIGLVAAGVTIAGYFAYDYFKANAPSADASVSP